MRVVIISCVFPPEPIVSSRTSADVAQSLAARGHTVDVITAFPSRPAGRLFPGTKRRWLAKEQSVDGYSITRCFATVSPRSTLASRLLENLSLGVTGALAALRGPRPDVLYVNTWPIVAAGLAAIVATLRGVPMVLSIQDVYPESLAAQGRPGMRSAVFNLLRRIDAAIAHRASAMSVPSTSFRSIYEQTRGIPADCIHVVPNWGDVNEIRPNDPGAAAMRERWGIADDAIVALYAGNVGVAAGMEGLITAMGHHDADNAYSLPRLVIAGAGTQLDPCRRLAAEYELPLVVHSPWLAEETSSVLAAADVLLLPTAGGQALASVPSKLISYLLASRPIVAQVSPDSATAHTIRESGAGWIVEPGDDRGVHDALRRVMAMPRETLREIGERGRRYAVANFSREQCLPRLIAVIENAGRNTEPSTERNYAAPR